MMTVDECADHINFHYLAISRSVANHMLHLGDLRKADAVAEVLRVRYHWVIRRSKLAWDAFAWGHTDLTFEKGRRYVRKEQQRGPSPEATARRLRKLKTEAQVRMRLRIREPAFVEEVIQLMLKQGWKPARHFNKTPEEIAAHVAETYTAIKAWRLKSCGWYRPEVLDILFHQYSWERKQSGHERGAVLYDPKHEADIYLLVGTGFVRRDGDGVKHKKSFAEMADDIEKRFKVISKPVLLRALPPMKAEEFCLFVKELCFVRGWRIKRVTPMARGQIYIAPDVADAEVTKETREVYR